MKMEIREPYKNNRLHKILKSGTVKELRQKIENFEIGKPSIFIGSSRESLYIAEKVKEIFGEKLFEVDIWDEGVFGKTLSSEEKNENDLVLSNVEWLKNFTDIYDYSIFLFVPEDRIVSETRILRDEKGKEITPSTLGTRHNVVFEFGMFLGRIGTKKTFVLFDKKATDFIKLFFTDIVENVLDPYDSSFISPKDNFVSLYPYENDEEITDKKTTPILDKSLKKTVNEIKKAILLDLETIDITFLPSTTLAIGYFNNFIKIFVENVNFLRGVSLLKKEETIKKLKQIESLELEKSEFKETNDLIRNKKSIKLKVVIPNSLDGAVQNKFKPKFNSDKFSQRKIMGSNRPLTIGCYIESEMVNNESLIFYDVPTTMNSSIEALEVINPHKDIKELLSEKERQNFKKVFDFKVGEFEKVFKKIRQNIEIISWSEFLKETNQT